MAGGGAKPESPPAAWLGMKFVENYYRVLAKQPENFYKFYKEQSVFSRCVENDGQDAETVSAIGPNEIHSEVMACVGKFERRACFAEILRVDSQESHQGGVLVHVTGHLTFTAKQVRQRFSQVLFLAKQVEPGNGYFVLNDMLRYLPTTIDASSKRGVPQAAPLQEAPRVQPHHSPRSPNPESFRPWVAATAEASDQQPSPPPAQPPVLPPAQPAVPQQQPQQEEPQEEEEVAEAAADPEEPVVAEHEEQTAAVEIEAEKPAAPGPKSWASLLKKDTSTGFTQNVKRGFPLPAAAVPGAPVLPPPTAAAKAEAARVVQQRAKAKAEEESPAATPPAPAPAPAAAPAAATTTSTAPATSSGSVRMWISKLPAEAATNAQEVLEHMNELLSSHGSSLKAVELDRKDAGGKDWGYLSVSSQEAADACVQMSKDKKITFQGRTLKVEYLRQTPAGGGASGSQGGRRGRGGGGAGGTGGEGAGASSGGGGKGDDPARGSGSRRSGGKGGKDGEKGEKGEKGAGGAAAEASEGGKKGGRRSGKGKGGGKGGDKGGDKGSSS